MWIYLIVVVYELVVRLIPTKLDLSIVEKIRNIMDSLHALFNVLIPNNLKNEKK
jgi:hypothetical protein